jgi:DNA-binding response OmpR family regulator
VRALIADDDRASVLLVSRTLERCGLDVTAVTDGDAALRALLTPEPPELVVLDWMMPSVDGIEICRRLRGSAGAANVYVILATARNARADIVSGLDAGADDYLVKPLDTEELRARVQVGMRVIRLRAELSQRVRELERALEQVKQLDGLLPICSYCKRIRNDEDYWQQIEHYLAQHSDARFSHGICPECLARVRRDFEGS